MLYPHFLIIASHNIPSVSYTKSGNPKGLHVIHYRCPQNDLSSQRKKTILQVKDRERSKGGQIALISNSNHRDPKSNFHSMSDPRLPLSSHIQLGTGIQLIRSTGISMTRTSRIPRNSRSSCSRSIVINTRKALLNLRPECENHEW
jgi:hypothetical protein